MQRRVFRVDGQPFLASRDGGYWETQGTLMLAIEGWKPSEAQPTVTNAECSPQPEEVPVGDATPLLPAQAAEPIASQAMSPEKTGRTPARAARRTGARTTPRPDSVAPNSADATAVDFETASTSDSTEAAREAQTDAMPESQGAVRRPRVRNPKVPRWVTAGKERRGRLK